MARESIQHTGARVLYIWKWHVKYAFNFVLQVLLLDKNIELMILRARERHAAKSRFACCICVLLRSPKIMVLTFFRRNYWTCRVCVHAKERPQLSKQCKQLLMWSMLTTSSVASKQLERLIWHLCNETNWEVVSPTIQKCSLVLQFWFLYLYRSQIAKRSTSCLSLSMEQDKLGGTTSLVATPFLCKHEMTKDVFRCTM